MAKLNLELVKQDIENNVSKKEIAHKYNCSLSAVYTAIKKLNIKSQSQSESENSKVESVNSNSNSTSSEQESEIESSSSSLVKRR